jgi:Mlc titration factor MtfA (ptsG expression regulator)
MWHWLQAHHRRKILEAPFPAAWEKIIHDNVPHARRLGAESMQHLRELVQVFVAEKRWEGCGGLVLTDEIEITVAAQACLMVLALPHDLFRRVESILIYPTSVVLPERKTGFFEVPQALGTGPIPIEGEAQLRGPVILAWDSVLRSARHPERGHNLGYHEFAHQLDMVDGRADGTPPLDHAQDYQRWAEVFQREFFALRAQVDAGKQTFLHAYGAVNEAEFFAVVTEQFFDQPASMKKQHAELYAQLSAFYRQDPAALDRATA